MPAVAADEVAAGAVACSELVSWLEARGATVSRALDVVEDDPAAGEPGVRGCVATRAIEEGELILELPLALCLAAPSETEASLGPLALELDGAGVNVKDAALAVALAEERALGAGSAWWPYLCVVGDPAETFPTFFDDSDLAALQSPALAESLAEKVAALERLASFRALDRRALLASWQLVAGRRFGCEMGRFMIPLGDLMNHSFQPTCAWEKPVPGGRASWRLVALRRLERGDPLSFEYCQDPNHLLLSTSGFVTADNPFNRIMAKPSDLRRCLAGVANPQSPADFARLRMEEIERQLPDSEDDSPGMSMFVVGRSPRGIQWNPLWLDLCALATSAVPEPHWSQLPGGLEAYCKTLEQASWALFKTTTEQDAAALQADDLSPNGALAARLLLGQKLLLEEAVGSLRQQMLAQARGA